MAARTIQKKSPAKATAKKATTSKRVSAKKVAPAKLHNLATVPEKRYADEYISRKFHGKTEFQVFKYAQETNTNVLIEGPTGPGKTSAALAYAATVKRPFYAIPSNIGIEPSQLFGKYIPADGGGFVWQDGPVTDIVRNGGILLINEVNFMPERVATVLFGLLDKRREIVLLDHKGEVIRAHRGTDCWCGAKDCSDKVVLVMADMNPDYEGTRPLNKAFRNRFGIQLFWDYDVKIEQKLVNSVSLVGMAENIRIEAAKGGFETPVSTNMLVEFEKVYYAMGFEFAKMNFVNHFATEERSAVEQIVQTFSVNITDDLDAAGAGEDVDTAVDGSDDEPEDEEDWGVYGVDWVYEDDEDGK